MSDAGENERNHPGIAKPPRFFIGSSPSMAGRILSPDSPAAGVMVSVNALRNRKSDFTVGDWLLDSGAFTEIARHGGYRFGVEEYYWQIQRWSRCGHLLAAVAQDWMCEPFVLERTGLTILQHQQLTIERYERLLELHPPVPLLPVLQGFRPYEYVRHLLDYGSRLELGAWVGVGSVCRRNGKPQEILDILASIKAIRPDLRLHGFGLKLLAIEQPEVSALLSSCDSMAWSYPRKFARLRHRQPPESALAHDYQRKIRDALAGQSHRRVPSTAGAGNGQGRKPQWKSKTKPIRVPEKYAQRLIDLARQWEHDDPQTL